MIFPEQPCECLVTGCGVATVLPSLYLPFRIPFSHILPSLSPTPISPAASRGDVALGLRRSFSLSLLSFTLSSFHLLLHRLSSLTRSSRCTCVACVCAGVASDTSRLSLVVQQQVTSANQLIISATASEDETLDEQMNVGEEAASSSSPSSSRSHSLSPSSSSSAVKRVSSMDAATAAAASPDLLSSLPPELRLLRPSDHEGGLSRVCARVDVSLHHRFGPYSSKIRKDPSPSSFNLQVSPRITCRCC